MGKWWGWGVVGLPSCPPAPIWSPPRVPSQPVQLYSCACCVCLIPTAVQVYAVYCGMPCLILPAGMLAAPACFPGAAIPCCGLRFSANTYTSRVLAPTEQPTEQPTSFPLPRRGGDPVLWSEVLEYFVAQHDRDPPRSDCSRQITKVGTCNVSSACACANANSNANEARHCAPPLRSCFTGPHWRSCPPVGAEAPTCLLTNLLHTYLLTNLVTWLTTCPTYSRTYLSACQPPHNCAAGDRARGAQRCAAAPGGAAGGAAALRVY